MKPSWPSRTEFSRRLPFRTRWSPSAWSSLCFTRSTRRTTTSINRRSRWGPLAAPAPGVPPERLSAGLCVEQMALGSAGRDLALAPAWTCGSPWWPFRPAHWGLAHTVYTVAFLLKAGTVREPHLGSESTPPPPSADRESSLPSALLVAHLGAIPGHRLGSHTSSPFPPQDLHKKYSYIRKTRPDGNCFYRAFGFSHLEALLEDSKELQRFKAISAKSKEDLVSQGFTEFTIEDFHNTFMDLIEQVEKRTSVADLLASFNDQSTSDYLVVYLRLLTSGYLQRESKFFEHFIEGGRTVKEFCQQEVEPMCKESDHIHIIALAQALSVSIQVEYMDRGEGGTTNPHVFPEGSEPKVYLLYRPGHYDILYK
uniref:Ubiquitin thioesterase OTUB1 n=1 Tax=Sarcophilus harrisii TaxID=9305 RepID=A0A7N4NR25_SARHA